METFLGMVLEQTVKSIIIHLDNYVNEVVAEYSEYTKKALVPISLGVAFKARRRRPELPDPLKEKDYRSFMAKFQIAATWIRFDISFRLQYWYMPNGS